VSDCISNENIIIIIVTTTTTLSWTALKNYSATIHPLSDRLMTLNPLTTGPIIGMARLIMQKTRNL